MLESKRLAPLFRLRRQQIGPTKNFTKVSRQLMTKWFLQRIITKNIQKYNRSKIRLRSGILGDRQKIRKNGLRRKSLLGKNEIRFN